MVKVAIIGGGIAGLSIALRHARAGDAVTLCEAAPALGGQLSTIREAGFVVEQGAEGFVAGSEAMASLAAELGIEASVLGQLTQKSYAFDGRLLHELGRGEAGQFLGFQVPRRDLGQGIRAFRGGMAEVVEALARSLFPIADLRVGTAVKGLTLAGGTVTLELPAGSVSAERVYVATNARSAAALLAPSFGAAATALASAPVHSSVTVSLAYPRSAIAHPLDATGFVVGAGAEEEGFRACTFTSSKLAARAPSDHALLRVFFRPNGDEVRTLADDAWVRRAERCLARALAPERPAERAWVARWPDALPLFDAAQHARVAALEAALAGSAIVLAGAAFHGSGIDGALRSALRITSTHSV